jgi:hypothetical protein
MTSNIDICPKHAVCNLFNDKIQTFNSPQSLVIYKKLYCNAKDEYWKNCKRLMIYKKTGKCADFVMPNSSLTVEQIIDKMKEQSIL